MKSLTTCICSANGTTSPAIDANARTWYPRIKVTPEDASTNAHLQLRPRQSGIAHTDAPDHLRATIAAAPSRPTPARRGSILAPVALFIGLAAIAYLAAGQSITAFHNSWHQTDTGYTTNGTPATAQYDFQDAPIPGPFSRLSVNWNSLKAHLPLFASAQPLTTAEAQ